METMGVLSTDMMEGWEIKYVDEKGAVHAELCDKDGNVIFKDDKRFVNSMKPLGDFTRETKRVIRVYGPEGDMVQELAEGTLAPYWDAAQAAKGPEEAQKKTLDALKGCVKVLEGLKVPVGLLEEVALPARAVANTLRDQVNTLRDLMPKMETQEKKEI